MPWPPGFTRLPPFAGGRYGVALAVSADGNTVVGSVVDLVNNNLACYWTPSSGPIIIAATTSEISEANGATADGSVIIGSYTQAGTSRPPFLWTSSGGAAPFAAVGDDLRGISADGTRIIGATPYLTNKSQACYWNRSGTRTDLGFLPGHNNSRCNAVSANGQHIAGESSLFPGSGASNYRAWLWSVGTGMVDLGLAGAAFASRAFGVSDDGTLVAGDLDDGGNKPFQWTPGGGMIELPHDTGPSSTASCASGNGTTIGGYANYIDDTLGNLRGQFFAYWTTAGISVPTPIPLDPASPAVLQETYPTGVSGGGQVFSGYSFGINALAWVFNRAGYVPPIDPPPTPTPLALSENLISLSVSYDRGHSFGSPVSQPMGQPGEYRKSLLWRRLGHGRDAVFKVEWSSSRPTALQGAWIEADIGDGGQEKK